MILISYKKSFVFIKKLFSTFLGKCTRFRNVSIIPNTSALDYINYFKIYLIMIVNSVGMRELYNLQLNFEHLDLLKYNLNPIGC